MLVGKYEVEFIEETHTYLVDGVVLPSITTIISEMLGKDKELEAIAPNVLEEARQRGIRVHKAIEDYEYQGIDTSDDVVELKNYKYLQEREKFEVLESERIVILELDGKPVACGRTDQLIKVNEELGINDIKSTYNLDNEYLYYQTNLYRIGWKHTYGVEPNRCYSTHLRGAGTRAFTRILVNDEIPLKLVRDYLEKHKEEKSCITVVY